MLRLIGFACVLLVQFSLALGQTTRSTDDAALTGVWFADHCSYGLIDSLKSSLVLTDHTFRLNGFRYLPTPWTGKYALLGDGQVDLDTDFFAVDESFNYPAQHVRGLYRLDGDHLSLCFSTVRNGERPPTIGITPTAFTISFVRAPKGVQSVQDSVTFHATDPQGVPAAGVTVFNETNASRPGKLDGKGSYIIDPTQPVALNVFEMGKTDTHGDYRFSIDGVQSWQFPLGIWDRPKGLIGFPNLSPASIVAGPIPVTLVPQRHVHGTMIYAGVTPPGQPALWRASYLYQDGNRIGFCEAPGGAFDYYVPPGHYRLHAYGYTLKQRKLEIDIPSGDGDYTLPPIELEQTAYLKLVGQPAPPLAHVRGWKNAPVALDALHGKVVLLCFWGYWCGPCVREMPTLMHLHDKYADRGLEIVAVHVDTENAVDSAEALDGHTASLRRDLWHGRDLPFSSALIYRDESDKDGLTQQYGVISYPTTIWLDRDGKVGGEVSFNDVQPEAADEQVEKLLAGK